MKNQKIFYSVVVKTGNHFDTREGLTFDQAQREEQRLWKTGHISENVKIYVIDCTRYYMGRDVNGNKLCTYKPESGRAFSVQTNGNMPETHRLGINPETPQEFAEYISDVGTERQREALGL